MVNLMHETLIALGEFQLVVEGAQRGTRRYENLTWAVEELKKARTDEDITWLHQRDSWLGRPQGNV